MGYLKKVLELAEEMIDLDQPEIRQVLVLHDSWCLIFDGGPCTFDPTVEEVREDA